MKKSYKNKLVLHSETLRHLNLQETERVAGGVVQTATDSRQTTVHTGCPDTNISDCRHCG
jgi:hypothetical protein